MIQEATEPAVRVQMSPFAETIYQQKYAMKDEQGQVAETWEETAERVVSNVLGTLGYTSGDYEFDKILDLIIDRKFLPGGRYLYASGRGLHQVQNCVLLKADDSREGWAETLSKSAMALMTGAGIGIDYSELRPSGSPIKKTGGEASGPLALLQMVNECGRHIMQGGARRSAIWAGLNWKHADVFRFCRLKDWSPEVRALKATDFNFPATADMTNISVLLDDDFFLAFEGKLEGVSPDGRTWGEWAYQVYHLVISKMVTTGEPGFSIDVGENAGESLRNACTEISSSDDSDICNLGSINIARIESLSEMQEAVALGTLFLLAGTVYSDLPYEKVHEVREKNRRLGLGIMGIHEWLLKRDKPYGPDEELHGWLEAYTWSSFWAKRWAQKHGLSIPVKTRAIAPNGTIGIIAETTTGIEPIFCVSYKRRYKSAQADGQDITQFQYVVDPTAKRLIDSGVNPNDIEDAYILSYQAERRLEMQAWVQKYVDHGISSTINLPYPITDRAEQHEFALMLFEYLPQLRGITCYPNGARDGQPLTAVPYGVAMGAEGVVFEENEETCVGGICGA